MNAPIPLTPRQRERDLAERLLAMAEQLAASPNVTLGADAIRQLPREVEAARQALHDDDAPRLVGAEASCVVELMSALTFARDEGDALRASRMVMFLNTFVPFMRQDLGRSK